MIKNGLIWLAKKMTNVPEKHTAGLLCEVQLATFSGEQVETLILISNSHIAVCHIANPLHQNHIIET